MKKLNINYDKLAENVAKKARITIDHEFDRDVRPEGELMADDAALVRKQLLKGNLWAWCVITVTAELGDFTGTAVMGACSYKSKKDFVKCGYYEDMVAEAIDDLVNNIGETLDDLTDILDGVLS